MVIDTSKFLSGSWKTSAIAVLAAAYGFFQLYMISDWKHFVTEVLGNPTMIVLFLLVLLGWNSKDSNVTGGTTPVTEEAKARVAAPTA